MEDPSTTGRPEFRTALGVKPLHAAGQLRQPEPDRSSFTGG
ncbi:hypothetical protein F750_0998 [Streptomyces sp. PAMC 26508]|nr:hypothetical protein F750_0998 [Streptomyces sp. PAMC 26508]